MDVTSLLNQPAAAASERCKSSTRETTLSPCILNPDKASSGSLPTPSPDRTTPQQDWETNSFQNRKPWSAGGYALPSQSDSKYRSNSIFSFRSASDNLDSEGSYDFTAAERHSRMGSVDSTSIELEPSQPSLPSTRMQQNLQNHCDDSQRDTETPDPTGHKFSDSHSSLSSFASWRSKSHSRISSATTLNSIHSARQSVAELPLLERTLSSGSESYQTLKSIKRAQQATVAGSLPPHQIDEMAAPKRSESPSNAVLNMKNANKTPIADTPSSDPSSRPSPFAGPSKSHKRAASAPDFCPVGNYRSSRQLRAVLAPPSEVMAVADGGSTQPLARGDNTNAAPAHTMGDYSESGVEGRVPKHQSEDTGTGIPAPGLMHALPSSAFTAGPLDYEPRSAKPSTNTTVPLDEDDEEQPVCMFVDDCDTGSQLRKAISHLFGRNKTCTLKIPKMVWVYYCRKHYQRVRYRNARTYPVTQMELVETQIERLKAWSDRNQARGKGAYIKSWTLSLRKREEKRLQGNKRGNEEEDDTTALGNGHIPAWIISELGDGFDTARMFAIAARLREEIENGTLNQVPEIEFLPDIVDDESEKDTGKPARYRRQTGSISAAKTSKRKASDFGVMTRQNPMYGDMGYGSHHPADEDIMSPSGKRSRTARAATFPHFQSSDLQGAYVTDPSHPYMASSPYGFGAQGPTGHPPRAQNIVPRIQPLEYSHHVYAQMGRQDQHVHNASHGHTRMSSYQGPQEIPYAQKSYNHYHAAAGYEQQSGQYTNSRNTPTSPPTLPSIATQMQGGGPMYGHPGPDRSVASMRPHHSHGPPRPMHQRSASAYTPGSRFVSMAGRPSSSGNGGPIEHLRYGGDAYEPPPPAFYEPARHGPPVYGRHEWTSEYSHASPAPQHPHQHYDHGSNYRPPPPMAMDTSRESQPPTRSQSRGYPNHTSTYPEPVSSRSA